MNFNERVKKLGYSLDRLQNDIEEQHLVFLRKNYQSMKDSDIKILIKYLIDGKEIPYPLYKDREKVMNP